MATAHRQDAVHEVDEWTKPPFLRRVRIQGYKSIAFCDVVLEPLTILVGRNASGKSNFLDALAFLRDLLDVGVNSAVHSHRGESIFSRITNTNRITFEIETDFPSYQMMCRATYRVELGLTKRREIEVSCEELELSDLTHGRQCGFTSIQGKVTWHGLEAAEPTAVKAGGDGYPSLLDHYRPDRLLLGVLGSQPFIDLAGGLRAMGCYNFYPDSIRELQHSIGSPFLERDGRNLPRAIEGLREIDEETLARVASYLNAIVSDIEKFEVVQLGEYETIRFSLKTADGQKPLELYAGSMSDGTLRVLASLVAAFQITVPHDKTLVAIEEPETSLHPAAMRALVDALDEATTRTQVLLTTHSAEMLDNPTICPENVRVVELINGQTVIAAVDKASVDIVRRKLSTLGGLERDNLLEPDPDDLARQHGQAQLREEPSG